MNFHKLVNREYYRQFKMVLKLNCDYLRYVNKTLAIANRSRVNCAQNTSRASVVLITLDLEI